MEHRGGFFHGHAVEAADDRTDEIIQTPAAYYAIIGCDYECRQNAHIAGPAPLGSLRPECTEGVQAGYFPQYAFGKEDRKRKEDTEEDV